MGIKDFHKSIKEYYPKAFKRNWLYVYDHIYIDINFALHNCSYGAKSEDEIFARLLKFFENIFKETIPVKSITVGADGVAPLAKLLLQRKRRLTISKNDASKSDTKDNHVSSLIFTPGTIFMIELRAKLEKFLKYIGNIYQVKINYLQDEIDEAELKIKYKLMENMNDYPNDTHIVVTNDADVVVMLTTLKNYQNAFIYCKNKDRDTISIGKLIDLHTDRVGCTLNPGLDFTLLSIMLGNDYLPKVGLINFDKLWDSYKCLTNFYPDGIINEKLIINKSFFLGLLFNLIHKTKKNLINKIKKEDCNVSLHDNYLDGLMWCIHTYFEGTCFRYNYMYEYQNVPNLIGLLLNLIKNKKELKINMELYDPIDYKLYAILVLPKSAKKLIDKKYHKFIDTSDVLYDQEECEKCNDMCEKIRKMNKKIIDHKNNNSDSDSETESNYLNDELKKMSKILSLHKSLHTELAYDDIEKIISEFNTYCLKN